MQVVLGLSQRDCYCRGWCVGSAFSYVIPGLASWYRRPGVVVGYLSIHSVAACADA